MTSISNQSHSPEQDHYKGILDKGDLISGVTKGKGVSKKDTWFSGTCLTTTTSQATLVRSTCEINLVAYISEFRAEYSLVFCPPGSPKPNPISDQNM